MRIVVMDEELHEALTVVELSASWVRAIEDRFAPRNIRLPVPAAFDEFLAVGETVPQIHPMRVCELRLEPVFRHPEPRPIFWYAYAMDPLMALELRAAFLPGQVGEVLRRQRDAYWRGVLGGAEPR